MRDICVNTDKYLRLMEKSYIRCLGKVVKIVGLTIESVGPNASLGVVGKIIS